MMTAPALQPIRLRTGELTKLFHALDPYPVRERDLDAAVDSYVVGWAEQLPRRQPIVITVHLPAPEAGRAEAGHLGEAFQGYFASRAEAVGWELRDLFRNGRVALLVGLAVLAACVALGWTAEIVLPAGYGHRFLDEGLIILGSVANWRPLEVFLYDWWPIVRRRDLYRRLASAQVQVTSEEPVDLPNGAP